MARLVKVIPYGRQGTPDPTRPITWLLMIATHGARWPAEFVDDIFKCIFLNENHRILIQISLKYIAMDPINSKSALVKMMAWRRIGTKPIFEQMMTFLNDAYASPAFNVNIWKPSFKIANILQKVKCIFLNFYSDLKLYFGLVSKGANENTPSMVLVFVKPLSKPVMTHMTENREWLWCQLRHPWWRHQMETFSALLAFCVGNSPVTGECPSQRPVTQSFDVFSDLLLGKWLSK